MRQTETIVDESKVGTKGYPRSWKELGYKPPIVNKSIEIRGEILPEEQDPSDVTP
jgi:uncharacterized protein YdaT